MNVNERYYRVLGLEPGATLDEVNQAYKDLAFIWHPDRIPQDNPRLQQKANEILKDINTARDRLRSAFKDQQYVSPSPPPPSSSPPPRQASTYGNAADAPPGKDLRRANFRERDLSGRDLRNANLTDANLSDAFMHKVNLSGANLFKANLFRANLLQANLSHANLREANLIGADLSGADLRGADLRGARVAVGERFMVKLTGAYLSGAILPDGSIHE